MPARKILTKTEILYAKLAQQRKPDGDDDGDEGPDDDDDWDGDDDLGDDGDDGDGE